MANLNLRVEASANECSDIVVEVLAGLPEVDAELLNRQSH